MTASTPKLPVYWHPDIALHDWSAAHVAMHEERLGLVAAHLLSQPWAQPVQPRPAERNAFALVHDIAYLELLEKTAELAPGQHYAFDGETRANRHTWQTLQLSAGAWLEAVDSALREQVPAAFCVGYAGHHARRNRAAGFCFTNPAAMATQYALEAGAERVAILDIDTHAGDGTVLSVLDEPRVFFGETYQPGFPGAFLSAPLREGIQRFKVTDSTRFQSYWERLFAQVRDFAPSLVLVSAGFDAHFQDPLTSIGVPERIYTWLGRQLAELPCPVVCGLEGGYNLDSTRRSAELFCGELALKGPAV